MCCYGKLEYVEDTLKRLTETAMHLASGEKLEDIGAVIKALGMLGDHNFDRLQHMSKAVGHFCDGDWRRPFHVDATGMQAANFSTFSHGILYKEFAKTHKHLFDFPTIFHAAAAQGFVEALPTHSASEDQDQPAYAIPITHSMTANMLLGSFCPETVRLNTADEAYKHRMYHECHGTQRFLDACIADWNKFQNEWRRQGATQEFVPYPYTADMIEGYFASYSKATGSTISASGPPKDAAPVCVPDVHEAPGRRPDWVGNDAALSGVEMQVNEEHKGWWLSNASATMYDAFARKERPHPTMPGQSLRAPGWWQAPGEAPPAALEKQPPEGEGDSSSSEEG